VSFRHPDFRERDRQDSFLQFGVDVFRTHSIRQGNRSHKFAAAQFVLIKVLPLVFFLKLLSVAW